MALLPKHLPHGCHRRPAGFASPSGCLKEGCRRVGSSGRASEGCLLCQLLCWAAGRNRSFCESCALSWCGCPTPSAAGTSSVGQLLSPCCIRVCVATPCTDVSRVMNSSQGVSVWSPEAEGCFGSTCDFLRSKVCSTAQSKG